MERTSSNTEQRQNFPTRLFSFIHCFRHAVWPPYTYISWLTCAHDSNENQSYNVRIWIFTFKLAKMMARKLSRGARTGIKCYSQMCAVISQVQEVILFLIHFYHPIDQDSNRLKTEHKSLEASWTIDQFYKKKVICKKSFNN